MASHDNNEELIDYEQGAVEDGYEGVMLRDPSAPYKYGRSTVRKGYLLKLKRFEDSEAEVIDIVGLDDGHSRTATLVARKADGSEKRIEVDVLLLTPKEVEYFRHGGLLHYVLRHLASQK